MAIKEGIKNPIKLKLFEDYANQFMSAYDLSKSPCMLNENPYNDSVTWKAYESFCIGFDFAREIDKQIIITNT